MKRVIAMRHGKANQFSDDGSDFSRTLSEIGMEQSRRAAGKLENLGFTPALIVSSAAARARQTAKEFARKIQPPPRLEFFDALYDQRIESYINCLNDYDTEQSVMAVGHAPVINDLIEFFSGEFAPLKTGGLAVLEFDDFTQGGLFDFRGQAKIAFSLRAG